MPAKPVTVGVAYAITETKDNFSEQHDELLDYLLTEREFIFTRSGAS